MKFIGSDFDGTIPCSTGKYIKDSTRALIEAYRHEGNVFTIVTGRSPVSFQKAIVKYGIDFYDYLICANGAVIYDRMGNLIDSQAMKTQVVREILTEIQAMPQEMNCFINTNSKTMTLAEWNQQAQVLSISIAFSSVEKAKQFRGFACTQCTSFLNGIYLDVMAKGVSKASALLQLYHNSKCNQLYCVGDGVNDVPMLMCTEHSYSFPYADEAARTHAKVICDDFDDVMKQVMIAT